MLPPFIVDLFFIGSPSLILHVFNYGLTTLLSSQSRWCLFLWDQPQKLKLWLITTEGVSSHFVHFRFLVATNLSCYPAMVHSRFTIRPQLQAPHTSTRQSLFQSKTHLGWKGRTSADWTGMMVKKINNIFLCQELNSGLFEYWVDVKENQTTALFFGSNNLEKTLKWCLLLKTSPALVKTCGKTV